MRAIRIHQNGGPDVLKLEEVDLPKPGKGEVRLRQHAVGVNFIDIYFRNGFYPAPGLPFTPGNEGAGEVVEVGPGVKDFKPGDRVAYAGAIGAYAEERNIEARFLVKLPRGDFVRNRRCDDAEGPHRAVSLAPDLSRQGGRLRSSSMRRRAASATFSASGAGRSARK